MLRENLHFEEVIFRVESLMVFTSVKKDEIIRALIDICSTICYDNEMKQVNEKYFKFANMLLLVGEKSNFSGNLFKKYIITLFLDDVNIFSLACERSLDVKKSSLYRMAMKDVEVMKYLMDFDLKNICDNLGYGEKIFDYVPVEKNDNDYPEQIAMQQTADKMLEQLMWYYSKMGCGDFAHYKMYKYDEDTGLVGIKNADAVIFSDIIGYEEQKLQLKENTEAFLNGQEANNMLIVGDRGTGKSSCVKALANQYFDKGLRLIEISKDQACFLPKLLNTLEKRGKKIIIYIDDLSYDDFEIQYKYLKSIMEGSAEIRPNNVLFYATSNRRHIVQEKWTDRYERDDNNEVHSSDTLNEKLSLSDRFGVTVTYPKPSRDQYLKIVVGLAKKEKINIPEDFLKEQALKWEINQNQMSGRTARQFINHIQWELKKS